MTIAWVSQGTVGIGSTSVTPGLPASLATGDGVLIMVVTKPDTATINTPADWTLVANVAGGGGTVGNGVGPTRQAWFFREKTAAWSTMPAIAITNGNASAAIASRYTKAGSTTWDIAAATGAWGTGATTTNVNTQAGSNPGIAMDDLLVVGVSNMDEAPTWSNQTISANGMSATSTERSEAVETTTGNDVGGMYFTAVPTSGPASNAPTVNATLSVAGRGTLVVVRMRELLPPLSTPLGHVVFSAGATAASHTSTAFTPRADSRIFAFLWTNAANQTSTISDSSGRTWTLETSDTTPNSFTGRIYVWSALAGASPSSTTVTFTHTGATWVGYSIIDIDAALAVSQAASDTIESGATTPSGTLASAATSGNTVLVLHANNDDNGSGVPEIGGIWTSVIAATANLSSYEPTRVSYATTFTGTNVGVAHDETGNGSGGAILELAAGGGGTNYPRSQSESVAVTDTVAREAPKTRALADTDPPVTDTLVRAVAQVRSTSDTAAVTDATVPLPAQNRAQAESVVVTDTVARSPQALARTTAETRSVTDTVARVGTRQRSTGETAAVGEATTPVMTRGRAVGDTATVSDDVVRAAQPLARGVADSAAVSETVAGAGTRSRAVADSASAADTTAPGLARGRTTSDSAGVTDTTAQTASRTRAVADTASASDATTRQVNRPRSQTESVVVTDVVVRSAYSRSRAIAESVAVTDTSSASTTGQLSRGMSENIAVTDTVARLAGTKQRSIAETRSVSDTVARQAPKSRALAETEPPVTDAVARSTTRSRAVSDATLAIDTSAIGVHRARATSEAAEILESVASVFSMTRGVLEDATLADLSRAAMVQAREMLEFVGVTDVSVLTLGEPNEYDIVVGPAVETFRVAAAAVPFTVGAASATYLARSAR